MAGDDRGPLPSGPAGVAPGATVEATLAGFLDRKRAVLAGMHPALLPVLDQVTALSAEGVGLHPAAAYWAWRGVVGAGPGTAAAAPPGNVAVLRAVSALGLLRLAARAHHRPLDRDGTPLGIGVWILVGDLALVWADELLHGSGVPAPALAAAMPAWEGLRTETTAGSYLRLVAADSSVKGSAGGSAGDGGAAGPPVPCWFRWALQLGAALAGADEAVTATCAAIGGGLDEAVAAGTIAAGTIAAGTIAAGTIAAGTVAAGTVAAATEPVRAAIAAAPLAPAARAALDDLAVAATARPGPPDHPKR
jgi:geranylgeranyl diphosphate synthase, type I